MGVNMSTQPDVGHVRKTEVGGVGIHQLHLKPGWEKASAWEVVRHHDFHTGVPRELATEPVNMLLMHLGNTFGGKIVNAIVIIHGPEHVHVAVCGDVGPERTPIDRDPGGNLQFIFIEKVDIIITRTERSHDPVPGHDRGPIIFMIPGDDDGVRENFGTGFDKFVKLDGPDDRTGISTYTQNIDTPSICFQNTS